MRCNLLFHFLGPEAADHEWTLRQFHRIGPMTSSLARFG
jgi:hypothetical protein